MVGTNAFEDFPNIPNAVFHPSSSALCKHRVLSLAKFIIANPDSCEQNGQTDGGHAGVYAQGQIIEGLTHGKSFGGLKIHTENLKGDNKTAQRPISGSESVSQLRPEYHNCGTIFYFHVLQITLYSHSVIRCDMMEPLSNNQEPKEWKG